MNQALRELWALQQADSHIDELEKKLALLDTGAAAARERDVAKAAHDQASSTLHAIETELKDVDMTMKSTEQKRKDFESRMYSGKVTAAKELDAMQAEVEMLGRSRDKLETRELELMDAQVSAREAVAAAERTLSEKQQALDAMVSASAGAREQMEKELDLARKERDPHEVSLSAANPSLLRKYLGLRPKLHNQAVATLMGTSCSACRVQLPGYMIGEIRAAEDVVICESCGRMLVAIES